MDIQEISTPQTRNVGNKSIIKKNKYMKAAVLYKTGAPEVLTISDVPVPEVKPGWVLVKIKAFGINRSELMMRQFEGDAAIYICRASLELSAWEK